MKSLNKIIHESDVTVPDWVNYLVLTPDGLVIGTKEAPLYRGDAGGVPVYSLPKETVRLLLVSYLGLSIVETYRHQNQPDSEDTSPPTHSTDFLQAALKVQMERGAIYNKGEEERSMKQIIDIFNTFHGTSLTEAQGWHFMQILKDVRLFTAPDFHYDSALDCVSYAALKAEAKSNEHQTANK